MALITDPKREFLVVNHNSLNCNDVDLMTIANANQSLKGSVNGKDIVSCFEGDLVKVEGTDEIVLTHQDIFKLTRERFRILRRDKIATSLDEALDNYQDFQNKSGLKSVICFEPKLITDKETITRAVTSLLKRNIENVYFDSFYGSRLDNVFEVNKTLGTNFPRSYHMLAGHIGNFKVRLPFSFPENGYDLISTQRLVSFGKLDCPVIYGAINSPEEVSKISCEENVIGAYVRLNEGKGLNGLYHMLVNSATNNKSYRRK